MKSDYEKNSGGEFDHWIPERYRTPAIPALPSKGNEGNNRYVIEPADGGFTLRTVAFSDNHFLAARKPVNQHIEEATDERSDNRQRD